MTQSYKSRVARSLATAVLAAFVLFIGAIGILMVVSTPSLKATTATKALVVVLSGSVLGAAVSTLMWSITWHRVQSRLTSSEFVSVPADPDAAVAWRWRRRFRVCWAVTILTMGAIVLAEVVAGNW